MFWIVVILFGGLAGALAGLQLGGLSVALFLGALGLLLGVAVRDITHHRHAIIASTAIAGVAGAWFGGPTLAVPAAILGFVLLLAVHDFLQKKDYVLPVGVAVMLLVSTGVCHFVNATVTGKGLMCAMASGFAFLVWVGLYDHYLQRDHTIRRNFPVVGWCRYGFELIGDELRQYWFAGMREEWPYNRLTRRYLYRSGKGVNNNLGFGTEEPYRETGKMHLLQEGFAIRDREMGTTLPRLIIGKDKPNPWIPSHPLGVAHMSFGALSEEAVRALSTGAKMADIHMGSGEGGLTRFHTDGVVKSVGWRTWVNYGVELVVHYLKLCSNERPVRPSGEVVGGAKIIIEIGPSKFGFRRLLTDPFKTARGREFRKLWSDKFDWEKFAEVMSNEQCVAAEVKGGQGAKPGQGGKLPKEKVTPEISEIRGIAMNEDCHSPNAWEEFDTVEGLVAFISRLQQASGKPVGYKTPIGTEKFIKQLAGHMQESGAGPDFITIDGGEGGTGAAPNVLADSVGLPLFHAIPVVDNALREAGVRDRVVLIGSGQLAKGDDIVMAIALGVDMVHIARAFLIGGLGCIMALRCHTNRCPTGIATQDPRLRRGLDPADKSVRVYNYASVLQREILMLCKALGVRNPWELTREHVSVVTGPFVSKRLVDLYPYPDDGTRNFELAPALEVEHPDAHDTRGPKLIPLGMPQFRKI